MTKEQADKLYQDYTKFDEAFRSAKKRSDFKKASEFKAKRDAINLSEVLKARRTA